MGIAISNLRGNNAEKILLQFSSFVVPGDTA